VVFVCIQVPHSRACYSFYFLYSIVNSRVEWASVILLILIAVKVYFFIILFIKRARTRNLAETLLESGQQARMRFFQVPKVAFKVYLSVDSISSHNLSLNESLALLSVCYTVCFTMYQCFTLFWEEEMERENAYITGYGRIIDALIKHGDTFVVCLSPVLTLGAFVLFHFAWVGEPKSWYGWKGSDSYGDYCTYNTHCLAEFGDDYAESKTPMPCGNIINVAFRYLHLYAIPAGIFVRIVELLHKSGRTLRDVVIEYFSDIGWSSACRPLYYLFVAILVGCFYGEVAVYTTVLMVCLFPFFLVIYATHPFSDNNAMGSIMMRVQSVIMVYFSVCVYVVSMCPFVT
jgi:hypothetical protein